MLTWTDAPGHGLGGSTPAWNNDLDLVVEVGADSYLGNVFGPDGYSTTGGAAEAGGSRARDSSAGAPGRAGPAPAADAAVLVLGGAGYTKEWPVERLWRDAKLLDIGAGTNEIRRMLIGRELIGT